VSDAAMREVARDPARKRSGRYPSIGGTDV
jgi:hypothetical protein